MTELSVVIPTHDRPDILLRALERLAGQVSSHPVEVIVVDDGSAEDASGPVAAADLGALHVTVLRQPASGPATARNHGLAAARGTAVLFLGDDSLASPGLLERHLAFHRRRPDDGEALLGKVVPAPPLADSPFIRWLHTDGVQFGYGELDRGAPPKPEQFWTSNVSAKRELLRSVGGFDEAFRDAACEDAELGLRLARAGMRLSYDPDALVEHFHPTDLVATLARMRVIGRAFRLLGERAPEVTMPRRPGVRHRVKAATLTALNACHVRPWPVRRATWRFLCDETQREAYWDEADGPAHDTLRVGARLAALAEHDPLGRPQAP